MVWKLSQLEIRLLENKSSAFPVLFQPSKPLEKKNLYSFLRIREFFSTFSASCFLTWPLLPHSLPPQPWLLLRLFTSAAKLVRLFPVRNGAALHVCTCWLVSCFIEQFGLCKMVLFNGLPLGLLGRLKRWFWIMCIPPYQSRCAQLEHRKKVGPRPLTSFWCIVSI